MDFYCESLKLKSESITHRRFFHSNAEIGMCMPKSLAYIEKQLSILQIPFQKCGNGITATIGSNSPVLLLRADMDALPMPEKSGLSFACPTGREAHTCGHDMHAAMLLTAAKILKSFESSLHGTVKLMFQPGEEILLGAQNMISHGVLTTPSVDAALSVHVGPHGDVGTFYYNSNSPLMCSCDIFEIFVKGKSSHGAYPELSINAISIASEIIIALNALMKSLNNTHASYTTPKITSNLTIGEFHSGKAFNIIPDTATLRGSFRTIDSKMHNSLKSELSILISQIAESMGGSATLKIRTHIPILNCDTDFTHEILSYIDTLTFPKRHGIPNLQTAGSDDFAQITSRVPGAYLFLSAGFPNQDFGSSHMPTVRFNEDVLPFGSAILAHCAYEWLRNH